MRRPREWDPCRSTVQTSDEFVSTRLKVHRSRIPENSCRSCLVGWYTHSAEPSPTRSRSVRSSTEVDSGCRTGVGLLPGVRCWSVDEGLKTRCLWYSLSFVNNKEVRRFSVPLNCTSLFIAYTNKTIPLLLFRIYATVYLPLSVLFLGRPSPTPTVSRWSVGVWQRIFVSWPPVTKTFSWSSYLTWFTKLHGSLGRPSPWSIVPPVRRGQIVEPVIDLVSRNTLCTFNDFYLNLKEVERNWPLY